jgi:hypothetical protein
MIRRDFFKGLLRALVGLVGLPTLGRAARPKALCPTGRTALVEWPYEEWELNR